MYERSKGRRHVALIGVVIAGVSVMHSFCVRADGDDYFLDANGAPRETDLVYFGSVKDVAGAYIAGATVRVDIVFAMESGTRHLTYEWITDVLGRYRTRNLGRTILGLDMDIDTEAITVTATKPGYRQVRRDYRSKRQEKRLIEVNFLMAKG